MEEEHEEEDMVQLQIEHAQSIFEPWRVRQDGDPSGALVAVVGRDLVMLARIGAIVRSLGHRVISLGRAAASASELADAGPDVVVAETMLPRMPIAWSASRPAVVVVTDAPEAIAAADRSWVDAIACKPVIEADLVGAITRARSRRRIARRTRSWSAN